MCSPNLAASALPCRYRLMTVLLLFCSVASSVVKTLAMPTSPEVEGVSDLPPPSFYIREYRVLGARHLPRDEVDLSD